MQTTDLKLINHNGFKWFSFSNGIHSFSKKTDKGFTVVECSEEQIYNGDLEFMCENGLTIDKVRKAKEIKKFLKIHNEPKKHILVVK